MNEKLLEEIGLTKGEIRVYFTLLKIGETTTGKIIEEAQTRSKGSLKLLKLASDNVTVSEIKNKIRKMKIVFLKKRWLFTLFAILIVFAIFYMTYTLHSVPLHESEEPYGVDVNLDF